MFKKGLINTLKSVINELEEENQHLRYAVEEKDKNNVILLENNMRLRKEIKNLENNLEFVTNNLSAQKRKKIGL